MALFYCSECGKKISDKAKMCPNCGLAVAPPKQEKSKLKIVLLTFLALVVIGAFAGNKDKNSGQDVPLSSSVEQKDPCEGVNTVEDWDKASMLWKIANKECYPEKKGQGEILDIMPASRLWKDFNNNEVAANNKYVGQMVAIEGRIYAIESSLMGYPEIVFNISSGIQTVRCQFGKKHNDTIAAMKKGQSVIAIGKVSSFVLGSMLSINDCYFGERME